MRSNVNQTAKHLMVLNEFTLILPVIKFKKLLKTYAIRLVKSTILTEFNWFSFRLIQLLNFSINVKLWNVKCISQKREKLNLILCHSIHGKIFACIFTLINVKTKNNLIKVYTIIIKAIIIHQWLSWFQRKRIFWKWQNVDFNSHYNKH